MTSDHSNLLAHSMHNLHTLDLKYLLIECLV